MGMVGLLQMRPIPSHQNKGFQVSRIDRSSDEAESLCPVSFEARVIDSAK